MGLTSGGGSFIDNEEGGCVRAIAFAACGDEHCIAMALMGLGQDVKHPNECFMKLTPATIGARP